MSTCPDVYVRYMHEYLDGEISSAHEQELMEHLSSCPSCQHELEALKKADDFLFQGFQSNGAIQAPMGFAQGVMARLPETTQRVRTRKNWLRQHPFLLAAAVFVLIFSASFFTKYTGDQQLAYSELPGIEVEGHTVIVPEDTVVVGDVTVKNGDLKIDGKVDGDVTVIHGKIIGGESYMASSANVSGEVKEIDQIFEWIWYSIKDAAHDVTELVK